MSEENNPYTGNNAPLNEKRTSSIVINKSNKKTIDLTSLPPQTKTPVQDDEWLSLSADWQAQPVNKTDISALICQTKRRTLWAKFILYSDIFATISSCLAFIYGWFIGKWEVPLLAFIGFCTVTSIIYIFYQIKIRASAWRNISDSPENAIGNALKGCESSLQYIKLVKWSCWSMLPIANWFVIEMASLQEKGIWRGIIIVNSTVLLLYFITHYFQIKRTQQRVNLLKNIG